MAARTADDLKAKGNRCFQSHDYLSAEKYYTQAIQHDPLNPALFTNRALTRIRLEQYDAVVPDCERAIDLLPSSMKAHNYLGQALLQLRRPRESYKASKKAYELAIEQRLPSETIAHTAIKARHAMWEQKEEARIKGEQDLLAKMLALISENMDPYEAGEVRKKVQDVFGKAEAERWRKREVPDYLIDAISFNIMWDPVVTKNGRSYERSTLMDHLKRSATDPLTREPLTIDDLRPNIALKEVCEEFMKENGWAAEW